MDNRLENPLADRGWSLDHYRFYCHAALRGYYLVESAERKFDADLRVPNRSLAKCRR